ncbi:uncharacterized protein ColSpa_12225 [Colletotrichum spaethianum]|uniref:Uncharacterized protein n=2 Tax=Colletotrichum spaethianum species complex TaxID=2707349 RepID=A0AA37H409_9PEZI|nr:uncharacterized protein ColSpa_12225 [Colletotrichum spaethianum]GJC91133.1 hypothetical protein ColLi_13971 [Colletotrichum liriopes]GKT52044.1 hypothetical protein ColSpa_12225 [Colletotrichum spaethianum]
MGLSCLILFSIRQKGVISSLNTLATSVSEFGESAVIMSEGKDAPLIVKNFHVQTYDYPDDEDD